MKKTFRKIHLWLSVPFGIFITLICFSGAMLVFEKEITEALRRDLYYVNEAKEQPLPLDSLMKVVTATLPDSVEVTGVTISSDRERAYQVSLSKPRRASIYVDQYTGEVKGRSGRLPFYDTMFHMHRWMMGSSQGFGKLLVGVSTLMLVIILITGILMWLSNRKKPLTKSLTISFTKGWPRFWHDLHVAGGIYTTVFLLALALTGLTWSFSWYRTGFYAMFGVEASAGGHGGGSHVVSSADVHDEGSRGGKRGGGERDRRGGRGGRGRRGDRGGRGGRGGRYHHNHDTIIPASPYAHWQDVCDNLSKAYPGFRQITVSGGSASVVPAGRKSLRTGDRFDFDSATGRITGSQPYSAQDSGTRVRGGVYMVHTGGWGGMLTRIITFLAALLGATLPLTGYYLWIRRLLKKSGQGHNHRA